MGQKTIRFTKAELARAASVAKDLHVMLRLQADGSIIVYPEVSESVTDEDNELDRELRAFEAKHGYD